MPLKRQAQVVLTQDGDNVARQQGQILGSVALEHGFAQIKRNQLCAQQFAVQPFDHGVVPVDLVGRSAHAARNAFPRCSRRIGVLHQQVFAFVVVARDECVAFGYQVEDLHALKPAVAQRRGHRALQGDGVGKRRADAKQGQYIAVAQGLLESVGVEHQVLHLAGRVFFGDDSLDQGFFNRGECRHAAAQAEDVANAGLRVFQLIDRAVVKRAGHGNAGPDWRNDDHVAGQQRHVFGLVSVGNEVVQVQRGDGFAAALELDVAHGAVGSWPATGEHGVDERAQP